ncbi:hypothetical protein [Kitasatospora sp. NPDC094015]|uniref:hypothetical protein n=1 Tax=Kitasatospora sp. NPDC094015 TaxID=3155205 RepID=UPI00332325B4
MPEHDPAADHRSSEHPPPAEGRTARATVPRQAEPGEPHRSVPQGAAPAPAAVPADPGPGGAGAEPGDSPTRTLRAVLPGEPVPHPPGSTGGWLEPERVDRLTAEWRAVQTGFVDDPARAVAAADALVGKAADLVTEAVAEQRKVLGGADGAPDGDAAVTTEQLRLALRDYRTLLDRLLAVG